MTTIQQALRRKLLVAFAALPALTGIGVYLTTRAALVKQFDATLRAKAIAISLATQQDDGNIVVDVPEGSLRELQGPSGNDLFQLWRPDSVTIVRSRALGDRDLPRRSSTPGLSTLWNLSLPSGRAGRAIGMTFEPHLSPEDREEHRPAAVPSVTLTVAADRGDLDRTLLTLGLVLSAGGALLMIATTLIVPRVLRRELTPLDRLADQAARIDAGSLRTRFEISALPGELAPIGRALNDLLARLEWSFERERQFSSDVAHELRTPIAELRSLAEVAMKWPDARDPRTDQDLLGIAIHMEGIVSRLLTLLRSERGLLRIVPERIPLIPLLSGALRPFADRIARRRLQISLTGPHDALVETDRVLLQSIVNNVIENAVEYTPEGGDVRVDGRLEQDRFVVHITNDVESFASEDVARLFDRFWRHDGARSATGHHGLGLSLARAFAHALGGDLTARLDRGRRLTLTLSGPARSPGPAPNEPTPTAVTVR